MNGYYNAIQDPIGEEMGLIEPQPQSIAQPRRPALGQPVQTQTQVPWIPEQSLPKPAQSVQVIKLVIEIELNLKVNHG
jgi:hypothetical protein